jgi:predicted PurR-regulated permease PerM
MALPLREQAKYWGAAAAVLLALLWLLGDVILPFVAGGAIAYMLDPLADRLARLGMGRVLATTVIALAVLLVAVLLVLAVIPTLFQQLTALINAVPAIFLQLQTFLAERFPELADETSTARQTLGQIGQTIQAKGGEFARAVLGGAMGIINAVVFIFVVPVVAFYLLLDWDRLLALAVAGLQFGLVVGAIAGAVTFIPYVGALLGGGLAVGLALFQFWGDWLQIAVIGGIFVVGQFLEGNVFTPKLVGDSVGLHPVWLLFALSAFGAIFGFLGLLVAVPVAAAIGVLARFGIAQYQDSLLFRGRAPPGDREP